jgi:hypothetical protein
MLTNFALGRFEAATRDFNDDLRPIVTPLVLAQTKAELDRKAGAYLLVKEAHQRMEGSFRAIELITRFEKTSVSVVVVFDTLDHVGSVHFNPIAPPPVDPVLEKLARELLANFVAGRFDEAVKTFDPNMRGQLSPTNMARLATNLAEVFGTFRSVTEVQQRVEKSFTTIDMTLAYTNGPVTFRVAFDARNRVGALHIQPLRKE